MFKKLNDIFQLDWLGFFLILFFILYSMVLVFRNNQVTFCEIHNKGAVKCFTTNKDLIRIEDDCLMFLESYNNSFTICDKFYVE